VVESDHSVDEYATNFPLRRLFMTKALDHSDAAANISIDGLAACCFNRKSKLWQIAVLHLEKHEFKLSINGELQDIETGGSYPNRINISATDPIVPDYRQYPDGFWFSGGGFHRDPNRDNLEDFRWVLDFQNPDFQHGSVSTKRPSMTIISIHDTVFYTRKVTPSSYLLAPHSKSFAAHDCKPVGLTNDEVGADICCAEAGEVSIQIDRKRPIILTKEKAPNSVVFTNLEKAMKPGDQLPSDRVFADGMYEKGDFFLYYDLFKKTGTGFWDIFGPPGSINRNGKIDCDTIRASGIESF
jgi:hypothetical protein